MHKSNKPAFHPVRRTVACLALGALVNVLIAWLCGAFGWLGSPQYGLPCDAWPATAPHWPLPENCSETRGLGVTIEAASATMNVSPQGAGTCVYWMGRYSYGLPLRSMQSVRRTVTVPGVSSSDWGGSVLSRGIPIYQSLPGRAGEDRRLALTPRLLGFVMNTLLYAGFIACLVASITSVTRASRRKHGRCESCGYPAASLDRCPECGIATGR